jgi:formylglycine-generating enzyme required for sulfatase activity
MLPAGAYRLGEAERARTVELDELAIGRYPVTREHVARWRGSESDPVLADHPATGLTYAEAEAFCAWMGAALERRVRLPTGDEWEAAARGPDALTWPWGDSFDADRCACTESGWGTTVAVGAHPLGASSCGAEQMAGNGWEWVSDPSEDGSWRTVRGGCYLDHAWGVRAARALPADPARATWTTGLRVVIERRSG